MKFIDEVTIEVSSGNGGPGSVSFRRESGVPRGGPDGGAGGRGGNVIFRANEQIHSLLDLRYKKKYRAGHGDKGAYQGMTGKDGEDALIMVPVGTVIKSDEGNLIKDLVEPGEYTFLEGGIGGQGNLFYKSSINQAPGYAQKGMPGKQATISLELKLLADIGFIGRPNAGKSTLISRVSAAKPKVADYPFTTLVPNLGVVRVDDQKSLVVADIPGLIPGAHKGHGLGIQFLKHIERTKAFVHLIDVSEMAEVDPIAAYQEINKELEEYDRAHEQDPTFNKLMARKQVVALNKIDTLDTDKREEIQAKFTKLDVETLPISAISGENIKQLIFLMGDLVFEKLAD